MVTVGNLTIHFGSRELFSGISFFIGTRDRIGLVGKNGAGKSTLLKTLAGIQQPNAGSVALTRGTTVGYLPQEMNHKEDATVYEEAKSAFSELQFLHKRFDELTLEITNHHDYTSDDYARKIDEMTDISHRLELLGNANMDEKIERVMKGLGFRSSDMNRKMNEFSGGWKMRVELGKILLLNPDLLLLDEPTNHLDIESIGWLEEFLVDYNGSIVLISHDRTFLDNVTGRTIEISKGKVYDYKFSYSKYIVQREEEIERQEQAARNQQRYIDDTKQLIDKFRAKKNKAAFAQSLIKKLDRLEKIEVDDFEGNRVHIRFPPSPHAGKVIMEGHALGKAYGNHRLFQGLDLMINRGDKIALVGRNGVGKSTLLKILLGKEGHEGEVEPGYSVQIGYYAQNQSDSLDGDKTVFETIDDEARGEMRKNVRGLLGAFLFSGDDVDKKVKVLSGGEKARLAFCKLLLEPYNFLVLDEPTNHLDLISKEVLKEALRKYDGTILVVSHDRDFLNDLTTLVYEIQPERLFTWRGNVLDYLKEKKATSIAEYERSARKQEPQQVQPKVNKNDDKQAEKDKKKLQQQLQRCEQEIAEAEKKLKDHENDLSAIDYSDHEKSAAALDLYNRQKKATELLYQKWEELQLQMDS